MKVCNARPVWVDEQGRAHRFRSRLVWTVACALASIERHDGVILPCHIEALRRMRSKKARAYADAFERLATLQRERERAKPQTSERRPFEDAAAVHPETHERAQKEAQ